MITSASTILKGLKSVLEDRIFGEISENLGDSSRFGGLQLIANIRRSEMNPLAIPDAARNVGRVSRYKNLVKIQRWQLAQL